jgi:hypothetical protein
MLQPVACNPCYEYFIRGEGFIPRPSGAVIKVLNPRPIPFKNNIPRCSAAGYVDLSVFFQNVVIYNLMKI